LFVIQADSAMVIVMIAEIDGETAALVIAIMTAVM